LLASRIASIKAGKMLQSLTALTQIHCAGDSTANINLTKSHILTSSDYYLLQNLQSCDSVYTLQMPAFLLEFEQSELLQQKALVTASRIVTKKKTAEAREEFRKAKDQAASAKALATAAQLTVEASAVISKAATAHSKALIAAAKKVDKEVNTQVEVDNNEQSNSSNSEVLDKDVSMDRASNTNTIKCRDRALII
jgi:hypothetical protein